MPHHIDMLMEDAKVMPMVDQLKLCPGVTQPEIVRYCKEKGIVIEAYSPFGTGQVFKSEQIQSLCEKYGRSAGQICLCWSIQMGFVPLPKSVTPTRIRENLNIFDFELSQEDVVLISGMQGCCEPAIDPDTIAF